MDHILRDPVRLPHMRSSQMLRTLSAMVGRDSGIAMVGRDSGIAMVGRDSAIGLVSGHLVGGLEFGTA